MKRTLLSTLVAAGMVLLPVAGCSTGSRDGSGNKQVFGPGSTGGIYQANQTPPLGGDVPVGSGPAGGFTTASSLLFARARHTATRLNDGRVLVTGGSDGQGLLPSTEIFDPNRNSWTNGPQMVNGTFASARQDHTATLLASGAVLITGGFGAERNDNAGQPIAEMLRTSYLFDSGLNEFKQVGDLTQNRGWHGAALMPSGDVLIAGGLDQSFSVSLTSVETFSPGSETWTLRDPGTQSRHTLGVVASSANATLVIGGADVTQGAGGLQVGSFASPRVELFNAASGTFEPGPDLSTDRIEMGANRMSNGNIFLAGGQGLDLANQNLAAKDTIEIYNSTSQTFTMGPTLNTPRYGAVVAELGNTADQLVIGGLGASGTPTAVCEVWSVLNNTIVGQTSMQFARSDHAAVTLGDGRVLVVGGFDATSQAMDSVELHVR